MFEKELKLPKKFIVGEIYSHRDDTTRFYVQARTACYATFLTNSGKTYKKKVNYDVEGNEYVQWTRDNEVYVLGTWHNEKFS